LPGEKITEENPDIMFVISYVTLWAVIWIWGWNRHSKTRDFITQESA